MKKVTYLPAWVNKCMCFFIPKIVSKKVLVILLLLYPFLTTFSQSQTFTSNGTFTAPAGVTSVLVQCWGAGGGGANVSNNNAGGGGGGGAFASSNIAVMPGNTYNIVVGKGGGAGIWGTSTSFNTSTVVAAGGASALSNSSVGGIGGTIASSVGTVRYAGGNGANGSGSNAGGGGSGAGSLGNGNNAIGSNGGVAKASYGGAGGAGRSGRRGNGTAGAIYGGGGGGAYTNRTRFRSGGAGADGLVIISYTCPSYNLLSTTVSGPVCPGSASTITLTSLAANLPVGTYTVTYNLSAPNAATGLTASATVTSAGTATFVTTALANVGATTVTIRNITSGTCSSTINTNNTATINVSATGPAIIVQPTSQSVCIGATVSLSVTSPTATSFQWQKNGVNITGATSSSYTINPYTAVDAAAYTVNAINSCGTSTSNTVYITTGVAQPAVTAGVSAATVCAGSSVNLLASSSSSVNLLSENFNSTTNKFTTINNSISGTPANAAWALRANSYNYAGTVFNSNDNSQFYLSNSDAQGTGGTTATILQTPVFNTQGLSAASLTFYHYYRFNSGSETAKVDISTNGTTWTTLATYTSTQGAKNNFALVTINLASYLNQPVVMLRFKYDATYDWYWAIDNINITGTLSTPSYSWTSLPTGFTSALQNPTGVTPLVNTTYAVVVTNGAGCTNSGSASVSVNALPAITTQPVAPAATCSGSGTQTISVATAGAGLTYSWRKGGVAITNGGVITGQGTATLTLTNPVAANTGSYDVVISGTCSPSVTSNAVIVSLLTATSITTAAAPVSQTVLLNGAPTNLTIAATGASLVYQWYSNNTNCNTCGASVGSSNGGQTNAYTPPANIIGTKYYYCKVTGSCGTVTSAAVAVTVTNSNTWAGGGSSNWNTATNWLLGIVPSTTNDVVIPAGSTPYPVLSASTVVNSLTINAGAAISIGSNTLTINGTVSGTGTITGSDNSSVVIGGNAGTIRFTTGGTNNFLKNFTINTGASAILGNALNITGGASVGNEGTLTVTGTGVLNTGGYLTIKSNEFGTARVAAGSITGGYINGDVIVERYIPKNASKGWRLLASNTIGQTINAAWQEGAVGATLNPNPGYGIKITSSGANLAAVQALGFDTLSLGKSIFKYVQSSDMLDYVPNTNNTQLSSEHGYFVFIRGDRSAGQFGAGAPLTATVLRSKGILFQGNQPAINLSAGQYAVVRNPYASRIDVRQIVRTGGLVAAFQVWDPKLAGAYGSGAFQTFSRNTITGNYEVSPGGGSYGANGSVQNYIESGSAFYVQATGSAGSVQVTEACKTAGSQVASFRPLSPTTGLSRILFNVYANNPTSTDMVDGGFIDFDQSYSNDIDVNDVRKNQNFYENFGIERNNTELVVERRQTVVSRDTLLFKMYNLRRIAYRLDIQALDFDTLITTAILHDEYTGIDTILSLSALNSYTFTVTADAGSYTANRFKIFLKQAGVVPVTFISVKAISAGDKISVQWNVDNEVNISHYEIEKSIDQSMFTKQVRLTASGMALYQWIDEMALRGINYYRIKAVDINGHIVYSSIIKAGGNNETESIRVVPNPVKDNIINLVMAGQPKGKYEVLVVGVNGQAIFKSVLQHDGIKGTYSFKIPPSNYTGTFELIIKKPGGGVHPIKIRF